MELTICEAVIEDVLDIAEIWNAGQQRMLDMSGDDSWGKEPFSEQEVIRWMAQGGLHAVGSGDQIVGTFAVGSGGAETHNVTRDWPDSMMTIGKCWPLYVARLAVAESVYGQGVGRRIISWIGEKAISQGRDGLRLCTNSVNDRLQRYFLHQGFRPLVYGDYRNSPHNFTYLQKTLHPSHTAPQVD